MRARRAVRATPRTEVFEQLTHGAGTIEAASDHPTVPQAVLQHVVRITWATGAATGVHVTVRRTGTLLPCVLTCAHVLPSAARARRSTLGKRGAALRPDVLYVRDRRRDIALCALAHAPVTTSAPPVVVGDARSSDVYVLHYPLAGALSVSKGTLLSKKQYTLMHDADTLPGSSGGPLVQRAGRRWVVVGVHCQAVDVRVSTHSTLPLNMGTSTDALDLGAHGAAFVGHGRVRVRSRR